MVDVWHPVVEAVKQGQLTNDVIDQAVLSTKEVAATKGRASYVGDRSIGHMIQALIRLGYSSKPY